MPLAFALIATARPTLTLLVGGAYQNGVIPLAVLVLGSTASIFALALGPVLIVLNETLLAALSSLIPIPLGVVVALVSIPWLGILGASIARALSIVISALLTWYFVRRKIVIRLDNRVAIKSIVASAVMVSAMEATQLFHYSRYLLPVYLSVGLLVYLLAMRALRAVNAADIDLVQRVLGPRSDRMCDLLSRLLAPK
jgi:O-antigen/teichoic acid export membrane protein